MHFAEWKSLHNSELLAGLNELPVIYETRAFPPFTVPHWKLFFPVYLRSGFLLPHIRHFDAFLVVVTILPESIKCFLLIMLQLL